MFTVVKGNILESTMQALVNPVNVEGMSGAGLALAFRNRWPLADNFYRHKAMEGHTGIGKIFVCPPSDWPHPDTVQTPEQFDALFEKFIVFFPTKDRWRDPSTLDYIQSGLVSLVEIIRQRTFHISSIAIPALGCGLGGLDWNDVRPMIERHFTPLMYLAQKLDVDLYEPA